MTSADIERVSDSFRKRNIRDFLQALYAVARQLCQMQVALVHRLFQQDIDSCPDGSDDQPRERCASVIDELKLRTVLRRDIQDAHTWHCSQLVARKVKGIGTQPLDVYFEPGYRLRGLVAHDEHALGHAGMPG